MMIDSRTVNMRTMLFVALPMMMSQATETIMLFCDRFFLSLLGKVYIAAGMSGGLSSYVFSSFFIGILGYLGALVGQYYGARRYEDCFRATAQACWLAVVFTPLCLLVIPGVRAFFVWSGHSPAQLELEFVYFKILMYGRLPVLVLNALSGYFIGLGRTRVVMVANILGMLANIPLNYLLIFGPGVFPPLGVVGAALGTLGGSLITCVWLIRALFKDSVFRTKGGRRAELWKPSAGVAGKLLKYGLPAGGELFLNVFLFNFFLQLMYSYGDDVAAAITITFNYDMLSFIPVLGIGQAVTAMVGQQMGAVRVQGARRVTGLALKLTYTYATFLILLFLLGAPVLVKVFTAGLGEGDGAVLELSRMFLRLAAIYILADGTQLVFAGALRGAGDTRWVMFISMGLHSLMAVGTFFLIRVLNVEPLTVWLFFIGFVLVLGVCMWLRYLTGRWQKIRMIDPADATGSG